MSTASQIAANQKNAQLSTGPKTPEAKSKTSLNAVKTGLTGRTVLLPSDDAAAYEAHIATFFARYSPEGDDERTLVQSLADTEWRLLRIPSLEAGIYALGHLEFADLFPNEDQATRKQLIETKTFLAYQRQLSNLSIQEARLRRQRDRDTETLRQMQQKRKEDRNRALNIAASRFVAECDNRPAPCPAEIGFVFSPAEIEARAIEKYPAWAARRAAKAA